VDHGNQAVFPGDTGEILVSNSLFASCQMPMTFDTGRLGLDHCGFFSTTGVNIETNATNVRVCIVAPFENGPFGRYYLNNAEGGGNLLRSNGEDSEKGGIGTASVNGVFHRTIDSSAATGEGTIEVSIGYHYPPYPMADTNENEVVDIDEDIDGDGLPDEWEIEYGLNPLDASGQNGLSGDPDNDGFTNGQELELSGDPSSGIKSGEQLVFKLLHCNDGSGLKVEILDSLDCGGTCNIQQVVTNSFEIGSIIDPQYCIGVVIKGEVECTQPKWEQGQVYDWVMMNSLDEQGGSLDGGIVFVCGSEDGEECDDCVMIEKEKGKLLWVERNGTIQLEYDTGDNRFHTGAYAEVINANLYKVNSIRPADFGIKEIRDMDCSKQTKVFAVPVAANNEITIQATMSMFTEDNYLPIGWTINGGQGTGRLERTISTDSPSKTEFTFSYGGIDSGLKTTVYVYEAGLKMLAHDDDGIISVGHSWWDLSADQYIKEFIINLPQYVNISGISEYFGEAGWQPSTTSVPLICPGQVIFGSQTGHSGYETGWHEWSINYNQLIDAMEYIYILSVRGASGELKYELDANNCTDQTIMLGEKMGIYTMQWSGTIPTTPAAFSNYLNSLE
jgi:hypothetical protein